MYAYYVEPFSAGGNEAQFAVAAEEAVRIDGKMIPLDYSSTNTGLSAITKRFPRGVVGMITPFNFPLNLVVRRDASSLITVLACLAQPIGLLWLFLLRGNG